MGIQDWTFVKGDQQVDALRGTEKWEVEKIRGQETGSAHLLLNSAQSLYIFRVSLYGWLGLPSNTGGQNWEETTKVPAKSPNASPTGKSRETQLPPPEARGQREERWGAAQERRNSQE